MNHHQKKSIVALSSACWFWLLVSSAPVTGTESGNNAEAVDKDSLGSSPNEEQADVKTQDIIDRIFSPLDNAVSDINRDLNKGDNDAPSEPKE